MALTDDDFGAGRSTAGVPSGASIQTSPGVGRGPMSPEWLTFGHLAGTCLRHLLFATLESRLQHRSL